MQDIGISHAVYKGKKKWNKKNKTVCKLVTFTHTHVGSLSFYLPAR